MEHPVYIIYKYFSNKSVTVPPHGNSFHIGCPHYTQKTHYKFQVTTIRDLDCRWFLSHSEQSFLLYIYSFSMKYYCRNCLLDSCGLIYTQFVLPFDCEKIRTGTRLQIVQIYYLSLGENVCSPSRSSVWMNFQLLSRVALRVQHVIYIDLCTCVSLTFKRHRVIYDIVEICADCSHHH